MHRRVTVIIVGAALAATATIAGLAPAHATSAIPKITFAVPRIVDPIHVYGEPNIAINPATGAIHASGPQGTGTQRSIWNVSVDNGDSYRIVQDLPSTVSAVAPQSALIPTKDSLGGGGGDTEIAFSRNGQTFFTDQAGLACYTAVTSYNDGATTQSSPRGCSGSGTVDREWMAIYDPAPGTKTSSAYRGKLPLVYQSYSGGSASCTNHCGAQVDYTTNGYDYRFAAGEYGPDAKGVPVVDQQTGKFLAPAADGAGLQLAVGVPRVDGTLKFHYHHMTAKGANSVLFPQLTQDKARTLYAIWVDGSDYQTYYAYAKSTDDWSHWSEPIQISHAPSNVGIFPWGQAGAAGILDVAWYGTKATLKQLGPSGPSARIGQSWHVFFAQIAHASSHDRVMSQVRATPHPMHYGDICLLGTACITAQGNRNMADFFKMAIDREGRARIIYTDSSNRLSQTLGNDTGADHAGAALDTVATQNTGLNAWTGKPLDQFESTKPQTSVTEPPNKALFKPLGGQVIPGADIRSMKVGTSGTDLVLRIRAKGLLSEAATAAGVGNAELVVRWQMGDTLYHAGVEMTSQGGATFYSGLTKSVDLCSVSGCKPNYLTYDAPPSANAKSATGQIASTSDGFSIYTVRVPLADIGNPRPGRILESLLAFVTVSPVSASVPLDNARAFADEVPLEVDATRPINYKVGTN